MFIKKKYEILSCDCKDKVRYFFTTTAPPLSFFSLSLHGVLNTSVKVSGGAHHYLLCKTSLKLGWLCYVKLWLGYSYG